MQTLRTFLSWVFAFSALVCLRLTFSLGTFGPTFASALQAFKEGRFAQALFAFAITGMMPIFGTVLALAWWSTFKRRPSARLWGTGASLITLYVALSPLLLPPHSLMSFSYSMLAIGVAGLLAFGRKFDFAPTGSSVTNPSLPADGTNPLLNRSIHIVFLALAAYVYHRWSGWVTENNLPSLEGWQEFLALTVIALVIAALHEFGHTVMAFALGMRLRSFAVGPFQWQLRAGQWEFEFSPRQILLGGGKTGVLPPRPDFPIRAQVCMASAGVVANIITGIAGLLVVPATKATEFAGLLALFCTWSVLGALMNLVPFKTGYNYSDGAQIFQLLSAGPWKDYHYVVTVAGSSLVTSVRPKDYDIDAIRQAALAINAGFQGLLLRLLAYDYYLDIGKFHEAAASIREAASIYAQASAYVPADLFTAFVFCNAYICRSATASRAWWPYVSVAKPMRPDVDYWLAAGALHWVEGNREEASQAWEAANNQAQRLPQAGAFDFARHRCTLLGKAIDETPIPTAAES